jgi:hypothetical protein
MPRTVSQSATRADAAIDEKRAGDSHPVDRIFDRLDLGKPVDEILDEMRGPRPSPRKKVRRR